MNSHFLFKILKSKKFIYAAALAAVLGFIGGSFGIAGFGTAISGVIPGAVVGGILGYAFASGYRIKKIKPATGDA